MRFKGESRSTPPLAFLALVALMLVSAGCTKKATPSAPGSPRTSTSSSPSALASSSGTQEAPYITWITSQPLTYRVDLIGNTGAIRFTTGAITDPIAHVGGLNGSDTINTLPFAVSKTRLYFMDANFVIHWLDGTGHRGIAINLHLKGRERVAFAVNADGTRIAVGTVDYSNQTEVAYTRHATNLVFVERMDGSDRVTLHREVLKLWYGGAQGPPGWGVTHDALLPALWLSSGRLVLGATNSAPYQVPVRNWAMDYSGFRVVDPTSGATFATFANCDLASLPPTPLGNVCQDDRSPLLPTSFFTWNGARRPFTQGPGKCPAMGPLSPDASRVATQEVDGTAPYHCQSTGEFVLIDVATGQRMKTGLAVSGNILWIDPTHVVVRVGETNTSAGTLEIYDTVTKRLTRIKGFGGNFWAVGLI